MLHAGTSEEWAAYKKKARASSKFWYWFTDDFLDGVQRVVMKPFEMPFNFTYWIKRRFVSPLHMVRTDLKPGDYHEVDTRLMHGLFTLLKDFVEVELCAQYMSSWYRHRKLMNKLIPFYARTWPFRHLFEYRNVRLGLRYLKWEKKLKYNKGFYGYRKDEDVLDEYKTADTWMKPTPQAEKAMETEALYLWWTVTRPARPDPMEASGWSAHCDAMRDKYRTEDNDFFFAEKTQEEKDRSRKAIELMNQMEKDYDAEDEAMMIRLIKVRQGLWT